MAMMVMPRLGADGAGQHGNSQSGCQDTGHFGLSLTNRRAIALLAIILARLTFE
jgi:hypothetical protein